MATSPVFQIWVTFSRTLNFRLKADPKHEKETDLMKSQISEEARNLLSFLVVAACLAG